MHPEEDVQTHANRVLALEEVQRLATMLWCVAEPKAPSLDAALLRIVKLADELMDFIFTDAEFMGVSHDQLIYELKARRPLVLLTGEA